MTTISARTVTALLLTTALLAALSLLALTVRSDASAQSEPSLAIDTIPGNNTATSLDTIDSCRPVASGDSFEVDITITDAVELLAWEVYFSYVPHGLRVTDVDVEMFQAANLNSSVFDASDPLPDRDGIYRITAADLGEPDAADTGSGVLARLTLLAETPGVHAISIDPIDRNQDDAPDVGPLLTNDDGDHPGDSDGDGIFDGAIANALIAVDTDCSGADDFGAAIGDAVPNVGDGGTAWWLAATIGGGAAAALVVGAVVVRAVLRRRASEGADVGL